MFRDFEIVRLTKYNSKIQISLRSNTLLPSPPTDAKQ